MSYAPLTRLRAKFAKKEIKDKRTLMSHFFANGSRISNANLSDKYDRLDELEKINILIESRITNKNTSLPRRTEKSDKTEKLRGSITRWILKNERE